MEDIKVGEYVRTKNKGICKIYHINEKATVNKYWVNQDYDGWCTSVKTTEIVKHSPNLIDLIEVGDYVNGILVTGKESTLLYTAIKGIDGSGYHIPISQYGDNIENIVTKEQFKSVSYEV